MLQKVAQPLFSVILPFYAQGDHASEVIDDFRGKLDLLGDPYELIVVVNGVGSLSGEFDEKVLNQSPRIVEHSIKKAGWGRAVNWGIAHASGDYICYTNSARTNGAELVRLLRYAKVSHDAIVKATRIERGDWVRKWTSIFYNIVNRIVLKTPIWDVNATPKIIPRNILRTIPLHSLGDSIDAELMFKAFKRNVPIIEIPTRQTGRKSGKSTTNFKSAVMMFYGLLKIKMEDRA